MLWLGSSICGFEGMCEIDSGCGSAWLERLVWDQEVAGSNPVTPILIYARVAQWWSTTLPRWGPRVRIPSRAFFIYSGKLGFTGFPLFFALYSIYYPANAFSISASFSSRSRLLKQ